jgi:hypothetical protein
LREAQLGGSGFFGCCKILDNIPVARGNHFAIAQVFGKRIENRAVLFFLAGVAVGGEKREGWEKATCENARGGFLADRGERVGLFRIGGRRLKGGFGSALIGRYSGNSRAWRDSLGASLLKNGRQSPLRWVASPRSEERTFLSQHRAWQEFLGSQGFGDSCLYGNFPR